MEAAIIPKLNKYFWGFVFAQSLIWILTPTLLRYAIPHDTVEGALWGQHLEWGYDKNPWMNAWLTRLGWALGGTSGLGIYMLSALFVGLSFWAVWKLAGKILNPQQALISALILEACVDYTLVPQGFNDNIIELGLWPLMFLFFYQAIHTQKLKYWLGIGITAGLALMAKYFTVLPLFLMLVFLVWNRKARESFAHKNLYLGFILFLIIISPHLYWLFNHHFLTLDYAFGRAGDTQSNILDFTLSQLLDFLGPIIILLFISRGTPKIRTQFNTQFLIFLGLGPFILTLLLGLIFSWHLYSEWGVPLVSLWGLVLIYFFNSDINSARLKKLLILLYAIMFLWVGGYIAGLYIDTQRKHSDNYPAQDIANYVTEAWQAKYHTPLKYVAGSRYIGGYMAFYSSDHPSVLVEWNPDFSEGINMADFRKSGAVFVQDNYYGTLVFGQHPDTKNGTVFPEVIFKQYPNLVILPVKNFAWKRGNQNLPPIPVLIAFLPPEK